MCPSVCVSGSHGNLTEHWGSWLVSLGSLGNGQSEVIDWWSWREAGFSLERLNWVQMIAQTSADFTDWLIDLVFSTDSTDQKQITQRMKTCWINVSFHWYTFLFFIKFIMFSPAVYSCSSCILRDKAWGKAHINVMVMQNVVFIWSINLYKWSEANYEFCWIYCL